MLKILEQRDALVDLNIWQAAVITELLKVIVRTDYGHSC